ncbi:MAG: VCBS repeat-containing protein [Rhodobacteraceae bacterium]|nr:VCBS repeat-containing protein [Paracoccaceae bacterium]
MRAGLAFLLAFLLALAAFPVAARTPLPVHGVIAAELTLPTDHYAHAVLGDALEWGGLALTVDTCPPCADRRLMALTITLPPDRVFEDITARVVDVTGDGLAEVVVVETHLQNGASLAVYDAYGRRIATPFIGQSNRWLAPAGVADFDGDGRVEIAYIDRPHLLKDLVFVRLEGDRLVETLRLPGLTNHRIGDDFISGGLRDCGQGPELILASPDWTRLMRVRAGVVEDLGPMPPEGLTIPPC